VREEALSGVEKSKRTKKYCVYCNF